jgi:trehalose 6-phosphate synthase/phosphatase
MRLAESRTPGSRIERKSLGVVWHWRGVSPAIGARRAESLAVVLRSRLPRSADVLVGDHVIEVRPRGIDKGSIAARLRREAPDRSAIVAIGDDLTDEDMFRALSPQDVTIHVGMRSTRARFRVLNEEAVWELLDAFSRTIPPAAESPSKTRDHATRR